MKLGKNFEIDDDTLLFIVIVIAITAYGIIKLISK